MEDTRACLGWKWPAKEKDENLVLLLKALASLVRNAGSQGQAQTPWIILCTEHAPRVTDTHRGQTGGRKGTFPVKRKGGPGGWYRCRQMVGFVVEWRGRHHRAASVVWVKNEAGSPSRRQEGNVAGLRSMKESSKKGGSDQCGVAKGRCEVMSYERLKLVRQLQWFSPATFCSSGTHDRGQLGNREWLCWTMWAGGLEKDGGVKGTRKQLIKWWTLNSIPSEGSGKQGKDGKPWLQVKWWAVQHWYISLYDESCRLVITIVKLL